MTTWEKGGALWDALLSEIDGLREALELAGKDFDSDIAHSDDALALAHRVAGMKTELAARQSIAAQEAMAEARQIFDQANAAGAAYRAARKVAE